MKVWVFFVCVIVENCVNSDSSNENERYNYDFKKSSKFVFIHFRGLLKRIEILSKSKNLVRISVHYD